MLTIFAAVNCANVCSHQCDAVRRNIDWFQFNNLSIHWSHSLPHKSTQKLMRDSIEMKRFHGTLQKIEYSLYLWDFRAISLYQPTLHDFVGKSVQMNRNQCLNYLDISCGCAVLLIISMILFALHTVYRTNRYCFETVSFLWSKANEYTDWT